MLSIKTKAFVLKKQKLPGQDLLITFFSQEKGKLRAFAKGIKKLTSRRAPHIQTGNLLEIMVTEKNGNYYLQETILQSGFSAIKKDESKVTAQYTFLYVLDRLLPEGQKEQALHQLTTRFFVDVSQSNAFGSGSMRRYLNEVFRELGYIEGDKSYAELSELFTELTHEPLPSFNHTE